MDFEADRDPGPTGDPSLADMTRSALSILLKNPKGFFLVVEGLASETKVPLEIPRGSRGVSNVDEARCQSVDDTSRTNERAWKRRL
ncbi:hypothetical protein JTB14_007103 [Gonioctena quinquepunctata]|nr:hypothetical protein JTB14_007103 [Gonioctena quinquepunctata]